MWLERYLIFPTWQIPPGDWNPTGVAFEEVVFHVERGEYITVVFPTVTATLPVCIEHLARVTSSTD